ncbi:MAG: hypothetical protein NZ108_09670, partial [Bacteroidia bacterium]|nr:hypothetical protein [Bacteroidia bacterium]
DGTWKYVSKPKSSSSIPTNPKEFKKGSQSTFLVKSNIVNAGVFLNPATWDFKKAETNESAEFQFKHKNKDAYGLWIPERIEVPLESLRNIALENAKSAAPDIEIVKEEYRTVNGKKVLMMCMDGTLQGMKFSYLGYYYAGENTAIQFLTYTTTNLMNEYMKDFEDLLNRFVVQ